MISANVYRSSNSTVRLDSLDNYNDHGEVRYYIKPESDNHDLSFSTTLKAEFQLQANYPQFLICSLRISYTQDEVSSNTAININCNSLRFLIYLGAIIYFYSKNHPPTNLRKFLQKMWIKVYNSY